VDVWLQLLSLAASGQLHAPVATGLRCGRAPEAFSMSWSIDKPGFEPVPITGSFNHDDDGSRHCFFNYLLGLPRRGSFLLTRDTLRELLSLTK
jgi:hypothetical protein